MECWRFAGAYSLPHNTHPHCIVPPVRLGSPRQDRILSPFSLLEEELKYLVECRKPHFCWPGSEGQTHPQENSFYPLENRVKASDFKVKRVISQQQSLGPAHIKHFIWADMVKALFLFVKGRMFIKTFRWLQHSFSLLLKNYHKEVVWGHCMHEWSHWEPPCREGFGDACGWNSEHEPTECAYSPESKLYLGLHQKKCGRHVKVGILPFTVLVRSHVECCIQLMGSQPMKDMDLSKEKDGAGPEEDHKYDQRAGEHLLHKQAERAEIFQHWEGVALGRRPWTFQ